MIGEDFDQCLRIVVGPAVTRDLAGSCMEETKQISSAVAIVDELAAGTGIVLLLVWSPAADGLDTRALIEEEEVLELPRQYPEYVIHLFEEPWISDMKEIAASVRAEEVARQNATDRAVVHCAFQQRGLLLVKMFGSDTQSPALHSWQWCALTVEGDQGALLLECQGKTRRSRAVQIPRRRLCLDGGYVTAYGVRINCQPPGDQSRGIPIPVQGRNGSVKDSVTGC